MTSTRILFASGVWVPASGGSEISAHTLVRELQRLGHDVTVLTGPTRDGQIGEDVTDGVPVHRVWESELESAFQDALARSRPQIVLTQLMWSERILRWAKQVDLPTVYFVRSEGCTLDLSEGSDLSPTLMIANSPTTQTYAKRQWQRHAQVVLPLVDMSDYLVPAEDRAPTYITMVNPIEEKGGQLFKDMAALAPDRRFLAVEGWHHWKRPDGTWDMQRLQSSAHSYGSSGVLPPETVSLDHLPNVEMVPAVSDMRLVYSRTRVLVVPSVWAEPFARVIIEAMMNGIPVLYSGTGSTDTAAADAGIRVPNADRVEAWMEALSTLDDAATYKRVANAGIRRIETYDMDAEVRKVHDVVRKLVDVGGGR